MIRSSKFPCKWTNCQFGFDNPEDLFIHLSDDHVGRKATNNLCLQCQWNNCGTIAAKRDHLASHLRVHLPLKPHQCPLCSKGFKRPQDLKKHERIHTVEHQASLLSNQPGYKPVRRRRKTTTTPTITSSSYSSTTSSSNTIVSNSVPIKDQSEISSELSSCSPSFSFGDSESSHANNAMDTEEGHYYRNGYMQDPLQEFIDDVLLNQSLPNYDEDMMERLNSIAPVLQYQQEQNANNWTLPCEPESIPALQHWLEQLSASVQTDENIYPEILTTSNQQSMKPLDISASPQLLTTDDYDLYPKLDDNNVWTSPVTSNTNHSPVTPNTNHSPAHSNTNHSPVNSNTNHSQFTSNHQHQQNTSASESSVIHTPPHYEEEEEASKPPPLPPRKNINPQFWSPGYIHSPTYIDRPSSYIRKEEYTPSEAINFSSPAVPKPRYSTVSAPSPAPAPAPTIVFETSVEKSNPPTPVIDPTSTVSFDDKKELMHMMNVFSSAKGKQAYKQSPVQKSQPTSASRSSPLIHKSTTPSSIEASPTIKKQQVIVKATVVDYNKEEPEVKSPYADLVGLIKNMKVEDEAAMRKRHVLLIDQLWKAVARTC